MSTAKYEHLSLGLGILSVVLLALFLVTLGTTARYKADVRYAHDIVAGFQNDRDLALKGEPPEAVDYLQRLNFPEGQPSPVTGSLSNFVETQRHRAIHDIIVNLRVKTGKDLGDKPEVWIREYGKN